MTGAAVEQEIVEGFGEHIDALGTFEDEVDGGAVDALLVRGVAERLGTAGWLGVASHDSPVDQAFALLADLAERAGCRWVPLPFPLLETWTAVRLLELLGPAGEDRVSRVEAGGLLVSVDVGALGGVDAPETSGGLVPYAGLVDEVLVVLRVAGAFAVHVLAPGDLTPATEVDPTVPSASCGRDAVLAAPVVGTVTAEDAERLATEYALLQTADIVGAAGHLHARLLDHLATREQFGRALDTFQALQHRVADMLVNLETSRSLLGYASSMVEARDASVVELAAMAKGYAAEECWRLGNEVVQLYGGLGYTWEARVHHAVRRIAYRALTGRSARSCYLLAGRRALARGEMVALS